LSSARSGTRRGRSCPPRGGSRSPSPDRRRDELGEVPEVREAVDDGHVARVELPIKALSTRGHRSRRERSSRRGSPCRTRSPPRRRRGLDGGFRSCVRGRWGGTGVATGVRDRVVRPAAATARGQRPDAADESATQCHGESIRESSVVLLGRRGVHPRVGRVGSQSTSRAAAFGGHAASQVAEETPLSWSRPQSDGSPKTRDAVNTPHHDAGRERHPVGRGSAQAVSLQQVRQVRPSSPASLRRTRDLSSERARRRRR